MNKIRLHKGKSGYFYYCRPCRKDHFFEYGPEVKIASCGTRHRGIEKGSEFKDLKDLIIVGCVWRSEGNHYQADCGFEIFMEGGIIGNGFKYCPRCGEKIFNFNRAVNDNNI